MRNEAEELLANLELRIVAERYAMAVDRGDGSAFADQFLPDGILEAPRGRFVGREALASVPPMMRSRYDRTHHAVVGLVPEFDGDGAKAETYTLARHYYTDKSGTPVCYEMTVRYDDIFRRFEGRWLLASRTLVLVGEAVFATGRKLTGPDPHARTET